MTLLGWHNANATALGGVSLLWMPTSDCIHSAISRGLKNFYFEFQATIGLSPPLID
jgi:hypothetical protein